MSDYRGSTLFLLKKHIAMCHLTLSHSTLVLCVLNSLDSVTGACIHVCNVSRYCWNGNSPADHRVFGVVIGADLAWVVHSLRLG